MGDDYPSPAVPLIGDWAQERDHVQTMFDYLVRSYMEALTQPAVAYVDLLTHKPQGGVEMAYLRGARVYQQKGVAYGLDLRLPSAMAVRAQLEGL